MLDVRATNVAVVPATVRRRVLPLVNDQTLTAGGVVAEERGHAASTGIARGTEMCVDERCRVATGIRHGDPVTMWIKRKLGLAGKRDDEVAVHAACYSTVYCAGSVVGVACTGTGPCSSHEASAFELFNHC